jgi:lipopolysaccharide transport system ATP-binding protein
MSRPVVEVEHLSKLYRLGSIGASSLRESLELWWNRLRSSRAGAEKQSAALDPRRAGPDPNTFWSLKDVSFQANPGEVIGIVGKNGAGKSTLLKILSRITEPTSGRAILRGRVVSLLEVGTGFHPELTGRENIYLNGAILGMKRAEITRKFDEIVEFSEVGQFIDTPVKRYSSGMYVRLAFAVAAHLEPEILLIDEVLAVGDAAFQRKCLGKMGEVATQHGRTVFFVSHNMGAIRALCETAILIEAGVATMQADPGQVISRYLSSGEAGAEDGQLIWNDLNRGPETEDLALVSIRLLNDQNEVQSAFEADKSFFAEITYRVKKRLHGFRVNLTVSTQDGELAFSATDHLFQFDTLEPGVHRSVCTIPGGLLNKRRYRLGLHFGIPGQRMILDQTDYLDFTIGGAGNQATNFPDASWPGVVCPKISWQVERVS